MWKPRDPNFSRLVTIHSRHRKTTYRQTKYPDMQRSAQDDFSTNEITWSYDDHVILFVNIFIMSVYKRKKHEKGCDDYR